MHWIYKVILILLCPFVNEQFDKVVYTLPARPCILLHCDQSTGFVADKNKRKGGDAFQLLIHKPTLCQSMSY